MQQVLSRKKLLSDLVSVIEPHSIFGPEITQALNVTSLEIDSRKVTLGSLFCAVSGADLDGHQYIPQAINNGALALVVEKPEFVPKDFMGPVIQVSSTREAVWKMAKKFYDDPSRDLFCIGVTGTNGKTSVSYLVEHLFSAQNIPMGVIGTINHHLKETIWESTGTTPDAISLQTRLSEMKEAGARAVVMEVTSHALDQYRAHGVEFDIVVFTNLTRDHLDYHQTMENYFASKSRLFSDVLAETQKSFAFSVINGDDPWGKKLVADTKSLIWTFGKSENCDYKWTVLKKNFSEVVIRLETPLAFKELSIPLIGEHNVENAVAAFMVGAAAQLTEDKMIESFKSFKGIPGRLQRVQGFEKNVFIDYAHTPDALTRALEALVQLRSDSQSSAKIWTVFGCGGDRDRGKRSLMGDIAVSLSDFVVVTSDNPRSENPQEIINEILNSRELSDRLHSFIDRKEAIAFALKNSGAQDVILIAGKGHENYQIIGRQKLDFDDYKTAEELLKCN